MAKARSRLNWRCQGASILGASHQRSGLPNQDAIYWQPESGSGAEVVLAVSDGHGSAKSFRSDRGSHFAVQVAAAEVSQFLGLRLSHPPTPGSLEYGLTSPEGIEQELPRQIVTAWRDRVAQDLVKQPISEPEWATLEAKLGAAGIQAVRESPHLAYGATLLAVVVTEGFILYLQLGDGDILCVNAQGQTSRPLAKDPRLIANETTSLSGQKAWQDLQVHWVPITNDLPALILVSTDGYGNAFSSEANFLKIGPDYQQMIQTQGLASVVDQLPAILEDASSRGSGDDVTLGILCQNSALDPQTPADIPELVDIPELNAQELLQENRKQRQIIKRLQLGLRITVLLALAALVLAGYGFYRTHWPNRGAQQILPPIPQSTQVFELSFLNGGPPLRLKVGVMLYEDESKQITDQQIQEEYPIAIVEPGEGGSIRLINRSNHDWTVEKIEGKSEKIKYAQPVLLVDGLEINFGQVTGRVTSVTDQGSALDNSSNLNAP
jgi:serine/threonine protein phosphatase PrpC